MLTAYLVLAERAMLASVLLVALAAKLATPRAFSAFTRWVGELGLVPGRLVPLAAAAAVAAEASTVVLLAMPGTGRGGLAAGAVLLAAFAVMMARVARRAAVPCRCFGVSRRPMGRLEIGRNVLLAALAAAAAGCPAGWPAGPLVPSAVLAGLAGAALAVRLEDIAGLAALLTGRRHLSTRKEPSS